MELFSEINPRSHTFIHRDWEKKFSIVGDDILNGYKVCGKIVKTIEKAIFVDWLDWNPDYNKLIECFYEISGKYYAITEPIICSMVKSASHNSLKCDRHKLLNVHIPKNASTSLLSVFSKVNTGYAQNWGGLTPDYLTRVNIQNLNKTVLDYNTFIVWRDPIDRFISIANMLYSMKDSLYFITNDLKSNQLDVLIGFAEIHNKELEELTYIVDGHLASQSINIKARKNLIPRLDFIVLLEDIQDFIKEKMNLELPKENMSMRYFAKSDLSETQISRIKSIYCEDYSILETYSIWKKSIK